MAPRSGEAKIPGHAGHKQGQGKDDADHKLAGLVGNLQLPCLGFDILCFPFLLDQGTESGLFHRRHQVVRGDHGRQIINRRPFGGDIYDRINHPGNLLAQRPLHVHGAVGTGHARYRKVNAGSGDTESEFFDLPDQIRR